MRTSSGSSSRVLWRVARRVGWWVGIGSIAAFAGAGSLAFAEGPPLDDLKWVSPETEVIRALTETSEECLEIPANARHAQLLKLGAVAFRSPVLLGGLAARLGLRCDTCHRDGHDNPVFFMVGVSGAPGTVDVTGSVFSSNRDDHVRNPVVIPTLIDAADRPPFGTQLPANDLQSFLHAAIIDEFQGEPPPAAVMEGLIAYLRALKGSACADAHAPATTKISFERETLRLREIFEVLQTAVERQDFETGEFVLLSLRAALGRMYARFPAAVSEREALVESSRSLAKLQTPIGEHRGQELITLLDSERVRLDAAIETLRPHTTASFYQPEVLRAAIESGR